MFFLACLHVEAGMLFFSYDTSGNQSSQQPATAVVPVITSQTNTQVVSAGDSVSFSVDAASALPLSFQWFLNGVAVSGATGDTLLLSDASAASQGQYTVTVMNSLGSVTSNAASLYVTSNPSAFLYWTASSGNFNTAGNWSANRVPGAADTAVIDAGSFTLPTSGTVAATQVTISVPYAAPTTADVALSITGNWTFSGAFTLATGRQFTVTGGRVLVSGPTTLNGANLLINGGAQVTFSNLASYTMPPGGSVQWTADGVGSVLNFPGLTSIAGSASPGTYFNITAQNSGTVNLPALTTITKPADGDSIANSGMRLTAHDSGTISAPNLTTFTDNDSPPDSSLNVYNNGTLVFGKLTQSNVLGVTSNGFSLPSLTALQSWQHTYWAGGASDPNSALSADPLNTGVPNIMKYALGMVPTSPSLSGLPTVTFDGTNINFSFSRARSDVTYLLQESTDLKSWTTIATNPGAVGSQTTVSVPVASSPQIFLKLDVLY